MFASITMLLESIKNTFIQWNVYSHSSVPIPLIKCIYNGLQWRLLSDMLDHVFRDFHRQVIHNKTNSMVSMRIKNKSTSYTPVHWYFDSKSRDLGDNLWNLWMEWTSSTWTNLPLSLISFAGGDIEHSIRSRTGVSTTVADDLLKQVRPHRTDWHSACQRLIRSST